MKALISARLLTGPHAQPGKSPVEIRDTRLKGFILRIQPSGFRCYYAEFGRADRKRIGAVGEFTPDEARERCTLMLANRAQGRPAEHGIAGAEGGLTLDQFITDHYAAHAETSLRSWGRSKHTLDTQFKDWKPRPLASITADDIDTWKASRLKAGRKESTVIRNLASLASVLSFAVLKGKLQASPMPSPKKLALRVDRRPKVRYLSEAEEQRLRAALTERDALLIAKRDSGNEWRRKQGRAARARLVHYGDHLTPAVLISMNTGLRRGELLKLTWSNIDLRHRRITVEGSTAKSFQTRHVPLTIEATEVFKRWREQLPKDEERAFPFGHSFKTAFSKLLRAAKIPRFRWHDLRHHFASRLVQRDVSLNKVRELLGHESDRMVMRYAHLAPANLADAIGVLDRK